MDQDRALSLEKRLNLTLALKSVSVEHKVSDGANLDNN